MTGTVFTAPHFIVDDGIPAMTDETRAALAMLQKRTAGDFIIPSGVHIVAAGNHDAADDATPTLEEKERIDRVLRERAPTLIFEKNGRIRAENMGGVSMLPMLHTLRERNYDLHFGAMARLASKRKK